MIQGSIHFSWDRPEAARGFSSAVSLHSHTDRSREGLSCVPRYAERNAAIGLAVAEVRSRYRRAVGRDLDFSGAYFIPPLAPAEAYAVEARQIESLNLCPMVSITDHDTVAAPCRIAATIGHERAPMSLEWTVPFGSSYFHVGIHNLPAQPASEIVGGLLEVQCERCHAAGIACAGLHDSRCLPHVGDWMERLSSIPETLIVLNHPLWDNCGLGEARHAELLTAFLVRYKGYIHALEVNGLRSWSENCSVMELSEQWGIPLISGGDRHGCEPNAVLNLTNAEVFSDFAREIRAGAPSTILFLRQYRQPLAYRKLRTAWDVIKAGSHWSDRLCMPWIDGRVLPLSAPEWATLG